MAELIKEPYLSSIKELLQERLGLHYSDLREGELSRKIGDAAKKTGYPSTLSYIISLLEKPSNRHDLEILASCVTIGETYFLRENEAFDFLKEEYLKHYIYKNRPGEKRLSIWSAGCSSGEEVYSLAGMIREMLPDHEHWEIKIIGTDINPAVLEKARKGIYSKWSFRKTPSWFMKYVEEVDDNKYQICACLNEMVEFKNHNLASDPYVMQDLDIIFCRNVLIYFSKELISKVTKGFYNSLKDEGVLILSPVEVSLNICERFIRRTFGGRTFFIKSVNTKNLSVTPEILAENESELPENSQADENPVTEHERLDFLYQEGLYLRLESLLLSKYHEIEKIPEEYQELLIKTYMKQGETEKAEEACQRIIISDQCSPGICYYLALINLKNKNYNLVKNILENILEIEPDHLLSIYLMGKLSEIRRDHILAAKNFNKAEELLRKRDKDEIINELEELTAADMLEEILEKTKR
ncbi:MAG: CheR family methyltransferase [Candidatus Stygibacter frigidus]|nr:CheR family methyltransferase [Candidatus Stygibacter frigidus]